MKTSYAIIVKATDEEAVALQKNLKSVDPYVDEICITITGKNKNCEAVAKEFDAKVSYFDWIDDFAAAREFNFSQCTGDFILWGDADDTFQGLENLPELMQTIKEQKIDGVAFMYHYGFDENGNCVDKHWKTQLLKNDDHFKWAGAIHEDPIQQRTAKWVRSEAIIRIHHTDKIRTRESYERNLRILERERKNNPKEPRTLFYLGRTYLSTGEYQKAIDALSEYLTLSGWDDERYEARILIGQCFFATGQHREALDAYNEAILEKEQYPDAYIQKAMTYLKIEEWEKAYTNFKLSIQLDTPEASTYHNPMNYTRDTFAGIAVSLLHMGKLDQAYSAAQKALKYDTQNKEIRHLAGVITKTKANKDTAVSYIEIVKFMRDRGQEDNILQLLHTVPNDLADNPMILKAKFDYQPPVKWPDKSVAVYCGSSAGVWDGDSVNKGGIGGSETAVVEITKRLVKKGYKVTVYNECQAPPEGLEIDGVQYKNFWEFNWQDKFDVLWVWRLPQLLDLDIKARKIILDLHDVPNVLEYTEERLSRVDKIFVKTDYHRSLLPQVSDEKFEVIGNGIDLSRFAEEEVKSPHRFVYSSTPDRGLDILLAYIWPDIKKAFKDAELHLYYGWNTFEALEKNNPERMAWMRKVKRLMDQPGIINHGRVDQKTLAKDLLKTSYWLYPTHFPEIHCITACEMQAAGVIPITSGYAALAETVKNGVTIEGDVYDPEYHKEFIKETIKTVKKDNTALRTKMVKDADQFSWDIVADEWYERL